jgi:hypothetical protein
MKQGKIIFIENSSESTENLIEKTEKFYSSKGILIEFATERGNNGFYSVSEALLKLLQKGAKKVSAIPISLGENYEIPVYWSTY